MKRFAIAAMLAIAALSGCIAPVGPVQVTRFHAPDVSPLGKGAIAVEPAPGSDSASLEWQTYSAAVIRQLQLLGYTEARPGSGGQVALVSVSRRTIEPQARSPVSVGVGGSTGTYGSGVGLGLGINLSPKPAAQVATDLSVSIRDRTSGVTLWEGRATFTVSSKSPMAGTALGAPKMSAALFAGFPGQSGATIEVK